MLMIYVFIMTLGTAMDEIIKLINVDIDNITLSMKLKMYKNIDLSYCVSHTIFCRWIV